MKIRTILLIGAIGYIIIYTIIWRGGTFYWPIVINGLMWWLLLYGAYNIYRDIKHWYYDLKYGRRRRGR